MSDFNSRKRIVWEKVIKPMQAMFGAPRNIKDNNEGQRIYLESLFEAVNGSISGKVSTDEEFALICSDISKEMINKTSVRVWYMPNDLKTCSMRHGKKWLERYTKEQAMFGDIKQETPNTRASKENATANGWTWDKLQEHRNRLQADIMDTENPLPARAALAFKGILDSVERKLSKAELPDLDSL